MGRVPTISLVRPTPCRDSALRRDEVPSVADGRGSEVPTPEDWPRLRGVHTPTCGAVRGRSPARHTARAHRSGAHITTPRRRQRRALSRHDSDTRALLAARSSDVLRRRVSDDQGGRGWRASLRDMRCSESTVCMPCAVCPAASTAPCACRSRPCAPRRACRSGKLRRACTTGCP